MPACAGKPVVDVDAVGRSRVHPRACGDSFWFPAFGVSSALFCARSEHTAAVARSAVLRRVAPPCCSRLWRDT